MGIGPKKQSHRGFPGIFSGHRYGRKKCQEGLINWEKRQGLRSWMFGEAEV